MNKEKKMNGAMPQELDMESLEKVNGGKIKYSKKQRAHERFIRNNERSKMLALEKQRREEAKLESAVPKESDFTDFEL